MVDAEVEKTVKELRAKENNAGIEAVYKIALYYTEKIALLKVPGAVLAADKKVDDKESHAEPAAPVELKTSSPDDADIDLDKVMAEEEAKLGLH